MPLSVRLQVLIDEERRQALERESSRTGQSIGALVREAVDVRLGIPASPPREAGRRLLKAPPAPVGEPDDLAAELAKLGDRAPRA